MMVTFQVGKDHAALVLIPESDAERSTLHEALKERNGHIYLASFYAEKGNNIYGLTQREDGQCLIGPNGEDPAVIINVF